MKQQHSQNTTVRLKHDTIYNLQARRYFLFLSTGAIRKEIPTILDHS